MEWTYHFDDGQKWAFSDGIHSDYDDLGRCRVYMHIRAVTFGDIDGDGEEEALVTVSTRRGDSAFVHDGFIYKMRNGAPALLVHMTGGYRHAAAIESMRVSAGDLIVRRFAADNSCRQKAPRPASACPTTRVKGERWRWNGSRMERVGEVGE